jgi:hypothetical protein
VGSAADLKWDFTVDGQHITQLAIAPKLHGNRHTTESRTPMPKGESIATAHMSAQKFIVVTSHRL